MNRVVVTGMGAVSAFGAGSERLWQSLLAGKNGISHIEHFPIRGEIVSIAASMPDLSEDIKAHPKLASMTTEDPSIKKFFLAVDEAVTQSGIDFDNAEYKDTACMIADRPYSPTLHVDTYIKDYAKACPNGEHDSAKWLAQLRKSPAMANRPFLDDVDSINHFVARFYGLTGPSLSIGTACASGNNAIGEAFEKIRRGRLSSAIVGGAYDFDINGMIGFTRIGALTTNPDPETACRPFDAQRSGFVMGSGCGILVLESLESATKRGATILAEVTGYGSFTDGYRATDPDPEGRAAFRTLAGALETSGLKPEQISYINAHGTSTKMNDKTETNAIRKVFGEYANQVPVSSTKSMIGHGIMAAGSLEAVACINAIRDNKIHGTRNYRTADPELDLDYVGDGARELPIEHVMSNNFGFGGQNATVIFSRFGGEK